jgi:PIN domain nuclease of toxin-antitoxin system
MRPLLLDTCAVIWIAEDEPIAPAAKAAMRVAFQNDVPVLISPMTAWEIGMLVARGRLTLLMRPQQWFARLLQTPGLELAEMTPDLLMSSSFLPGDPPRDPADRIIAATAREHGCTLVTRDRPLLAYGQEGHLSVIAC